MSPDTRRHRGAHPEDPKLFDTGHLPALRAATAELSWLLSRGYAMVSSVKLVGDRHHLNERQRLAISRAACADASLTHRQATCLPIARVAGEAIVVDGFNTLITIEAALSGGVLLACRDGCVRDLSGVHGTYRAVAETAAALDLIGEALGQFVPRSVEWLLDQPISNSGRLAQTIRQVAEARGWPWVARAVYNPDAVMVGAQEIVVTSDSIVLDGAKRWVNLSAHLIRERVPGAWVIDLVG